MNKRNISVICAVLALTVLLSGCSFLGIGANKLSYSSAGIAGQVESVSGKTITLTLGFKRRRRRVRHHPGFGTLRPAADRRRSQLRA